MFPETSAALHAITAARQELEEEIGRRELRIKEQQAELDRLLHELREVKALERSEMRKLKLVETRTAPGELTAGSGATTGLWSLVQLASGRYGVCFLALCLMH